MPSNVAPFVIRPAQLPQDAPAIAAIDTSFASDQYWRVEHAGQSFRLELASRPAFTKAFGVYDLNRETRDWQDGYVAEEEGRICAFAAGGYQFWNRRYVLWHLYVAPECRRSGMGTALLLWILKQAQAKSAVSVWLETSNLNAPAIAWYRAHGFDFAGLDLALYDGSGHGDEVGVYLMRSFA